MRCSWPLPEGTILHSGHSEAVFSWARRFKVSFAHPLRRAYIPPVPAKKNPENEPHYNVGDHTRVNLHAGRIVEAVIRAVIERTDGDSGCVDER